MRRAAGVLSLARIVGVGGCGTSRSPSAAPGKGEATTTAAAVVVASPFPGAAIGDREVPHPPTPTIRASERTPAARRMAHGPATTPTVTHAGLRGVPARPAYRGPT